VSIRQILALMRRHRVAVIIVLVLAAAAAWDIKKSPPAYSESANVIFTAPAVNPYSSFTQDLISTAYVMTKEVLNPDSQQQIRAAGGTAAFTVGLVNLNNEQFPYYGDPYVTLTATSMDPAEAHRTFTIVARSFQQLVATRQAQLHVPVTSRISTHLIVDSGPIAQTGSPKRTYAGIMMLAIVATFTVAIFLDRHPIWPHIRRYFARRPPRSARPGLGQDQMASR
jgi:hypothetical protein